MDKKNEIMRQFELSKLQNATQDNVIQDRSLSQGFKNAGKVPGTAPVVTNAIQKISKPSDILDKVASFRAAKLAGKKLMGAVPLLGAGVAAFNGDSAMAAEELGQDLAGPAGMVYEAAKPGVTGPAQGGFDDRMERGQLTDEEKLQLRQQTLQTMGK